MNAKSFKFQNSSKDKKNPEASIRFGGCPSNLELDLGGGEGGEDNTCMMGGRVGKYTCGVKKVPLWRPPLSLSHSVASHSDLISPGLSALCQGMSLGTALRQGQCVSVKMQRLSPIGLNGFVCIWSRTRADYL